MTFKARFRLRSSAACTTVISAILVCAHAEDAPMPKSSAEAEMRFMDTDHDGKVSAMEHTVGAKKMFETMDGNKNGTVTASEMDASVRMMMGAHRPKETLSSAEKIKVVDTDQDGELSAEEHFTGSREMFSRMDTDNNRSLTLAEIQAGHDNMMSNKNSTSSK